MSGSWIMTVPRENKISHDHEFRPWSEHRKLVTPERQFGSMAPRPVLPAWSRIMANNLGNTQKGTRYQGIDGPTHGDGKHTPWVDEFRPKISRNAKTPATPLTLDWCSIIERATCKASPTLIAEELQNEGGCFFPGKRDLLLQYLTLISLSCWHGMDRCHGAFDLFAFSFIR